MLSHVSFGVSDLERSIRFYDAVFHALGVVRVWTTEDAAGYGAPGGADRLALFRRSGTDRPLAAGPGFHLAFFAGSREQVDAFHATAVVSGGRDRGRPGPRPAYGPSYYAAFVEDPDGHKLEVKVGSAT